MVVTESFSASSLFLEHPSCFYLSGSAQRQTSFFSLSSHCVTRQPDLPQCFFPPKGDSQVGCVNTTVPYNTSYSHILAEDQNSCDSQQPYGGPDVVLQKSLACGTLSCPSAHPSRPWSGLWWQADGGDSWYWRSSRQSYCSCPSCSTVLSSTTCMLSPTSKRGRSASDQ